MLLKRIGKKLGLVGASLVLISAQLTPFFVFGGQASAQVTDYVIDGKIRICHRTSAANNPYTSNNISVSAADGESGNSGNESDHYGEHKEELAATKEIAEELKNNHEDWGDIIPPIINVHDGLNWTTEGIAMWENDCNFVEDDTTVQVMKVLSPNIGMFDLYVNGSKVVTDAINNSTSEKVKIDPSKNVEVKEKPGTGLTKLDDYTTDITCTNQDKEIVATSSPTGSTSRSKSINKDDIEEGDEILCVFTNTLIQRPIAPVPLKCEEGDVIWSVVPVKDFPKLASDNTFRIANSLINDKRLSIDTGLTFAPGKVDISQFLSWDGYVERVSTPAQPEEQWTVQFWNGGSIVGTSSLTPDLADGVVSDQKTGSLSSVYLPNGADKVLVIHKALLSDVGENANSVTPVSLCLKLNQDPTLTVTKNVLNDDGYGTSVAEDFDLFVNEAGPLDDVKDKDSDSDSSSVTYLHPSTEAGVEYTITETNKPGYDPSEVTCVDLRTKLPVNHPVTLSYGQEVNCQITNDDKAPPVKIVASKIVCKKESLLPNWGTGGDNITALTAINWVTKNKGCELVEGWTFEYAFNSQANPDDNTEVGGSGWTPFGPTDENGESSTEIKDVKGVSTIWIREQLKTGYLGFTYNENSKTNVDSISAEIYCNTDVLNYDNYDKISNPKNGNTYYCVAWNVELGTITAIKYNDLDGNGERDKDTEEKMDGWEMTVYNDEDKEIAKGYTGKDKKGEVTFTGLLPGKYKVCETMQEGWKNTDPGSVCTEVVVKSGKDEKAKFGNTVKKSKIVVTKFNDQNQNGYFDDEYEVALPDWTITLTPKPMCEEYEPIEEGLKLALISETECPKTLSMEQVTDENGKAKFKELNSGLYEFDEILQDNWEQTSRYCDTETRSKSEGSVYVSPGETVNCFVGNYKAPGIKVVKTGPNSAPAGSQVQYTFTVTNIGGSSLSDVEVNDTITGLSTAYTGDLNENKLLDIDETWVYTANYLIPTNQVANVVNTVNVCGYEVVDYGYEEYDRQIVEESTQVCDSDDHSLSVPQVLGNATTSTTPTVVQELASTGQNQAITFIAGLIVLGFTILTTLTRKTIKTTN